MDDRERFLRDHERVTRRRIVAIGAGALASRWLPGGAAFAQEPKGQPSPALGDGIKRHPSLLTPPELFYDVSRGKPLPHSISDEQRRAVGLTRETWALEVISDPDHPVSPRRPMTRAKKTALDFAGLLKLAENHRVRFLKAMTCLNLGCPLGFGLWEGVPLRDVIKLTEPRDNIRRVFYYGYHNDAPEQMFRSSLPISRVLEDPFDLPPVILCYKLNGEWLTPKRGGPVRVVVPEAYGFKSIKWVSHVVLTNLAHANDTYAEQGNDIDSPMKTFAATIDVPSEVKAGEPIPITGYAQVGQGGLAKAQAWIHPIGKPETTFGRHFEHAPWVDMKILGPPKDWGGGLAGGTLPKDTVGIDPQTGQPSQWPLRFGMVHWAGVYKGLPAGSYMLRCRTIDAKGFPQPLPRPFRRSGHSTIEEVPLKVI